MAEPIKVTIDGKETEVFLKDDVVAIQSTLEKTQRDLEDTRMEVLTPQYDEFLKSLDKPKEEKKVITKEETSSDDEFKNLTPKQMYERIKSEVTKEFEGKLTAKEKEQHDKEADNTKKVVASFAARTPDYDQYRPVMYGMSLDPKNADLTIDELYTKAKLHVKSIQTGSTDEQRKKSSRTSTEKPGNDNESFTKLKSTSNEKIAADALEEVKASLGPIPPA